MPCCRARSRRRAHPSSLSNIPALALHRWTFKCPHSSIFSASFGSWIFFPSIAFVILSFSCVSRSRSPGVFKTHPHSSTIPLALITTVGLSVFFFFLFASVLCCFNSSGVGSRVLCTFTTCLSWANSSNIIDFRYLGTWIYVKVNGRGAHLNDRIGCSGYGGGSGTKRGFTFFLLDVALRPTTRGGGSGGIGTGSVNLSSAYSFRMCS